MMASRRSDRELMTEAQSLKPTVHVGHDGVTQEVVSEVARQLKAREVVKERLLDTSSGDRKSLAGSLAERTSSRLIEVRGKTVVLARGNSGKKGRDDE